VPSRTRNQAGAEVVADDQAEPEVPVRGRQVPKLDKQLFLTGRPPIEEYLGFAQQAAVGSQVDVGTLMEEWRRANDRVVAISASEAGTADDRATEPVPPELDQLRAEYLADPVVHRSFAALPSDVQMVNLDDLVVFQKVINVTYADQLRAQLESVRTPEALFEFCLAIDQPRPPVRVSPAAANSYAFVSESSDLRCLEAAVIDAGQISEFTPNGYATNVLAFFIGYGTNAVNVVRINGRLILNNGSHRAYALRAAGIGRVPVVVQEVTRQEELVFIPPVKQSPELYLAATRPPMLKDYFDAQLHTVLEVPRRLRQVRLTFGIEATDTPSVA
jgi:hypothetical protein